MFVLKVNRNAFKMNLKKNKTKCNIIYFIPHGNEPRNAWHVTLQSDFTAGSLIEVLTIPFITKITQKKTYKNI